MFGLVLIGISFLIKARTDFWDGLIHLFGIGCCIGDFMGRMYFEGWKVKVDDLNALNAETEVRRLGLVFVVEGDMISAEAVGNSAIYLNVLSEVKNHIVYGAFNVEVSLSDNKRKRIVLGRTLALDGDEDILRLLS